MSGARLLLTTARLAVPLYLLSLLLAAFPVAVTMLGIGLLAGNRPWRADLLGPDWLNLTVELVGLAGSGGSAGGIVLAALGPFVLLPVFAVLQALGYAFLAGGMLERLLAPDGSPPFWSACRRWFWPFVRLGLVGLVALGLVGSLGMVLEAVAGPYIGANASFGLTFAIAAVVLGWLELGRAIMVGEGRRSARDGLRRAARAGLGWRPVALWLLLALVQAGLGLLAIGLPDAADPYAGLTLLQALAAGQVLAFAGAWLKVLRLGVAVRLALAMTLTGAGRLPFALDRKAGPQPT